MGNRELKSFIVEPDHGLLLASGLKNVAARRESTRSGGFLRTLVWGPVLAGVMVSGCADPELRAVGQPTVIDSAGVELRSYPDPGFSVSGAEGSLTQLYQVGWNDEDLTLGEIHSGRILPGGRALAFDASASEFVVLDGIGRLERKVGRRGQGPGEYQSVGEILVLPGDSILVYDSDLRRLSILDPELEFARSWQWTRNPRAGDFVTYKPAGVTESGEVVWTLSSWSSRGPDSGIFWLESPVLVGPPEAQAEDSAFSLPFLRVRFENGRAVADRFQPIGRMRGHPDGVVWAQTDRSEVHWYSASGDLVRILRWQQEPIEVTDSLWTAYADGYITALMKEGYPPEREAGLRRSLEEARTSAAPSLPLFGLLSVGSDGTIWLEQFSLIGDSTIGDSTERFIVLSRDGEWVGRVAVPPSFTLLDSRDGVVLGVERNDLDVVALGLYRIELESR